MKKLLWLFCLVLWLVSPTFAQENSALAVPLSEATLAKMRQTPTLADALLPISESVKVPFVLEGRPLVLAAEQRRKLEMDLKGGKKSAEEVATVLATAYGYSFHTSGKYVLFVKNYENVRDFPEVSYEEMRWFIRVVAKITQPFNPKLPRDSGIDTPFARFAASLTPGQLEKIKQRGQEGNSSGLPVDVVGKPITAVLPRTMWDEEGIPVSQFTPVQRQFLSDVAMESFIGEDADQIIRGAIMLEELDSRGTKFYYKEFGPFSCLTCERNVTGQTYYTPLSPRNHVGLNFGTAGVYAKVSTGSKPVVVENEKDVTDPTPGDYKADGTPKEWREKSTYNRTLGEIAIQFQGKSALPLRVAPALATKTLTILNAPSEDALGLANAAAEIFNLRVYQETDKETGKEFLLLESPKTPAAKSVGEVSKAIGDIMPAPLKRMGNGWRTAGRASFIASLPASIKNADGTIRSDVRAGWTKDVEYNEAVELAKTATIQRFRILVEPQLKKAESKSLVWVDMDEEEKWLAGFVLCCESFPMISKRLDAEQPDYLTNFDKGTVYGETYINQGRLWLRIGMKDSSNKQGFSRMGVIEKR